MNYHVNSIVLETGFDQYRVLDHEEETRCLKPLSKFNILVGANNSGKSRFMRLLSSTSKLRFVPKSDEVDFDGLEALRAKFTKDFKESIASSPIGTYINPEDATIKGTVISPVLEGSKRVEEWWTAFTQLKESAGKARFQPQASDFANTQKGREVMRLFEDVASKAERAGVGKALAPYEFKKVYVPILRGLRTIDPNEDFFFRRTKQDYFSTNPPDFIFTGQGFYKELRKLLLGSLQDRKSVRAFERFVGERFFDGQELAIIPRDDADQDVVYIKIGTEEERPIYELGDGLQAVLIMLFPLFKYKGVKLLVFLDEPELHMHPGLQRKFLRALCELGDAQFFLTTHSNHLLDLSLDFPEVSVFTFTKSLGDTDAEEKPASFRIENVSNADRRPLELLGVRNSSVLLSNCTIWVEGITDRAYLAHYLRMYSESPEFQDLRRYQEDLHYSFVEYGGGNITHWSFLDTEGVDVDRLCGRLFLIVDKDDEASAAKTERHEKLQRKLGDRFCRLPCREIENLLAPCTLKAVVMAYEGKDAILEDVEYSGYQNEPLGRFIEDTWLKGAKKRVGKYKEASGTVTRKSDFCEKAISAIGLWSDLSSKAQDLTKAIYNFIATNNRL